MKNFSPGQKVVFSTEKSRTPRAVYLEAHPQYILPDENEVCTIIKQGTTEGFWILREYPVSRGGTMQAISDLVLFPVYEIGARLTDQLLTDLDKKIYKLPSPLKTPTL